MNLLHLLRATFFPSIPVLRNRRNGLAVVNSRADEGGGSEALVNCIVRTVRVQDGDFWVIDPPLKWITTCDVVNGNTGIRTPAGCVVLSAAVRDESLTPLRNPGREERDESTAWLPAVPSGRKERA